MNIYKKVRYYCSLYKDKKFYFRQEYLYELNGWGEPRRISPETFLKRKNEGFPVEYRRIDSLPTCILHDLKDIDTLIDIALDTKDKDWFLDLIQKRESLLD